MGVVNYVLVAGWLWGGTAIVCTGLVWESCRVAMTSKELRVSLKLQAGTQTGQLFEDVLVSDTACTLAEFLEGALKDLEVKFW